MARRSFLFAVALVLLLTPTQLTAGGPPWLCLPIDGVTPDNANACADLLDRKLDSKIWRRDGSKDGVQIHRHNDQSYATFYMGEDVRLSDIERALKGSGLAVPRDRLRLFGHVILEIDAPAAARKTMLAALDATNHVSIAESEDQNNRFLVTVDMPYPKTDGRPEREAIEWDTFERNDFASDQSTKSESPATARKLPGYDDFRALVAKDSASLKDIRWSTEYACRPQGAVVAAKPDTVTTAQRD